MTLHYERVPSPIGNLLVVTSEIALCALHFDHRPDRGEALLRNYYADAKPRTQKDPLGVRERLEAYFGGDLTALDAIPTQVAGSEFQTNVWQALRAIPVGTTTTYGALARRLGTPDGARAVGLANGANPIAIVHPCHRVIGADGTLTGFGGGLKRKAWLLRHEGLAVVADRVLSDGDQLALFNAV